MEEKNQTTPTKPEEKKEPKFWKGNTENAFAYSVMIGFFVGAANMIFLHWGWHPGIVSMVLIFLIVGTNPAFADKRTPEEKSADAMKRIHEESVRKQEQAAKTQAKSDKMDEQIKKNQLKIQKQQIREMRRAMKCPHLHLTMAISIDIATFLPYTGNQTGTKHQKRHVVLKLRVFFCV